MNFKKLEQANELKDKIDSVNREIENTEEYFDIDGAVIRGKLGRFYTHVPTEIYERHLRERLEILKEIRSNLLIEFSNL